MANQHNNISRIRAVSYALEELNDSVVFVGGAVVSLYADRLAEEIRPTNDVDILIELANYRAYAAIEEKLRAKGFINDLASGVICRYSINGITVDVMPTSEEILGFSNRWYKLGYATAQIYDLGQSSVIKLFRPEYFLASKFDAFTGRGKNDGRTSTDFEDIVYLLNNRVTIWQEIAQADEPVKKYILRELQNLLDNRYRREWISANLERSEQNRVNHILEKIAVCLTS